MSNDPGLGARGSGFGMPASAGRRGLLFVVLLLAALALLAVGLCFAAFALM